MSVGVIKFLDRTIGSFLCLVLSLFVRKKEVKGKKVLFIQLWSIGETILTLPAISALKKKYKDVTVLGTTRNKDVFGAADVKIITLSLHPLSLLKVIFRYFRTFDLIYDAEEYLNISSLLAFFLGKQRVGFSHDVRSGLYNKTVKYNDKQHGVKTFLDLVEGKGKLVKLKYGKDEEKLIKHILKSDKVIGIAPGAAESAKSRMWPKYAELCNKLNYNLVFMGSDEEKDLVRNIISQINDKKKIIDTTGRLTVKELFCLIDKVDLLICNDAGPLHIASAQNTPVIGLFGPNTPVRFGPLSKKNAAIYKQSSCEFSPCINVHKGQIPDCLYAKSKDYQKCMKAISVDEVLKSVKKILRN